MKENQPCCAPRSTNEDLGVAIPIHVSGEEHKDTVLLEGGNFLMGTNSRIGYQHDGEGPERTVTVSPFMIDRFAVTIDQYSEFVEKTGYVTDAERIGWSFVFAGLLPD